MSRALNGPPAYLPLRTGENYEAQDRVEVGMGRPTPIEDAGELRRVGNGAEDNLGEIQNEQREPHFLVGILVMTCPQNRRRLVAQGPAVENHRRRDDQLNDPVCPEPPVSRQVDTLIHRESQPRHSPVGQRPTVPCNQHPNRK